MNGGETYYSLVHKINNNLIRIIQNYNSRKNDIDIYHINYSTYWIKYDLETYNTKK